jgi:hypothetical protein
MYQNEQQGRKKALVAGFLLASCTAGADCFHIFTNAIVRLQNAN